MKIFLASFSRASEGALSKLKREMGAMLTTSIEEADYIMAAGDRKETFDFVQLQWELGKKVIHLWAGEGWTNTCDDAYRAAMTLMSDYQLCTNPQAQARADELCRACGKNPYSFVVGNVMLDNIEIDESRVPITPYDLILINPPEDGITPEVMGELMQMRDDGDAVFIRYPKTCPRPQFLGLLKHCRRFYTNSSCQYYEAPIFLKPEQIISIGKRNRMRGPDDDMTIPNATENIIKALKTIESLKK